MLKNNIELTEDIKNHILQNFIYIIPKSTRQSKTKQTNQINTTINNYNTINNYISNMGLVEKMKKYMEYKQLELIDFEDKIETKYTFKAKRLDNDDYKYGFELSSDDFLEIINEISSLCKGESLENMNVVYDNKIKNLKLYEQGNWSDLLLHNGVKSIIQTIQAYYLNSYEQYLIRNIYNQHKSRVERQKCKELLEIYYTFIAAFEIDPFIQSLPQDDVSFTDEHTRDDIIDHYWKLYTVTRDNLKRIDINRTRKQVLDILKRNTIKNIDEMNKQVLELFQVDEVFKQSLLENKDIA